MSDTTYNVFQHYGTNAERLAFVPNPAAGIQPIYIWYETDTGDTYLYDTSWHLISAAGGGLLSMFAVSNTTQSTSGTADLSALSFAGAGIASVGITGGSVLISVPAGGGGITNVNLSAGTTSQNLSNFVLSNFNNVSFGLSGSTVTATATVASTQGSVRISAGTTSNLSSGFTFSNSNNVSFGINAGVVTASVTVASTQGSINVSAGTTSSNVSAITFSNSNGLSFGLDAGTITGSYTVPTVPAQLSVGDSNLGNTAGDTGVFTGRVVFVGSNNITLSGSSNAGSATLSIVGGGGGNTGSISAGTTRGTLGEVVFSNSNNISFGMDGQTVTATVTIATSLSNIRVSAGTTSNLLSAVTFSNSNGLSFGLDASTITGSYSVPVVSNAIQSVGSATGSGTNTSRFAADDHVHAGVFSVGVSTGGNTIGDTRVDVGRFVLQGGNNVTLSQITAANALNTIVFSGPNVGGAQTGISGIEVSNTTYTSGTVTFRNANGISFGSSGANGISASYTVPSTAGLISAVNVSAGTTSNNLSAITFSNANNVSFGLDASTITASIATSLTNIRVSAGTTSNLLSAITFSNSNNVSFGMDNGTVTATATVASTLVSLTAYATGNTTLSSTGTIPASSIIIRGSNNISVGVSNGSIVIDQTGGGGGLTNIRVSAGTTSNLLSDITFADSNGVSFGINASTITATVSTYSTVGTATTGYSVASANSVGTVTRWAAEDHRHAGVGGIGISTAGNTLGTTGSQLGTYWLQGSNNITISQITSNNGSHTGIILGRSLTTLSLWANLPHIHTSTAVTQTSGSSIFIQPFTLQHNLSVGFLRLLASYNDSAVGTAGTPVANSTFSVARFTTFAAMLYSQGVGASSLSIQSYISSSGGMSGSTFCGAAAQSSRYTVTVQKSYPALGFTTNLYTSSYAVSSASIVVSSNSNTLFTGPRYLDIPFSTFLTPGNYWLGIGASTSSTSNSANISFAGTAALPISIIGNSQLAESLGVLGAVTSASANQLFPGLGVWTTNASGFTKDSIGINSISQVASNVQIPFQFILQS